MEKYKKPFTINSKYLENIHCTESRTKTRQRVINSYEKMINYVRTYNDLSFKQDIEINKIIDYLERESRING